MDFAKKILNKYGWKDGDGLGKNNNGIAKPLKATLKFDNAGLGADEAASDFNNHWWERVFNEAAQNVNVESLENRVVIQVKDENEGGVEISTKSYSVKKLKKARKIKGGDKDSPYVNFLQSATLTKAGDVVENEEKISVDDIAMPQVKILTDEELFQACGGRTAHKGARHGLKLSGKLSRVEKQEAELLAKMLKKTETPEIQSPRLYVQNIESKTSKKKNKAKRNKGENVLEDELQYNKMVSPSKKQRNSQLDKKSRNPRCNLADREDTC